MGSQRESCRLVIENENLAAWMTINNSFAIKQGRRSTLPQSSTGPDSVDPDECYWVGVMIQLGRYRRFEKHELMRGFDEIVLENGTSEPTRFSKVDFATKLIWIDIAPESPRSGRKRPTVDAKVRDLWFVETPSLHGYLKPYDGGITIWTENGFHVSVEALDSQGELGTGVHRRFTFEWDEPTQATLHVANADGTKQEPDKVIHGLQAVRICGDPHGQSGIHQDPPQRP